MACDRCDVIYLDVNDVKMLGCQTTIISLLTNPSNTAKSASKNLEKLMR
jgi:hypothetical protein